VENLICATLALLYGWLITDWLWSFLDL